MNKTYLKTLVLAFAAVGLTACGAKVEIPPGAVGKITGADGYREGIVQPSKFRLDWCWAYCDKLVLLDVADHPMLEQVKLLMPQDKLEMVFDVRMTLALDPEGYEHVFSKMPVQVGSSEEVSYIAWGNAYQAYAQQIVRTEAREFLSKFKISEIMSSREAINAELVEQLSKSIREKTPFALRYAGLADIQYPSIIVDAQNNAAERREKIAQEEAQLDVARVQMERELQEQQMQRKIDVERAEAEAQVNRIMAKSMTPEYVTYRGLQVLEKLAASENKVFVPTGMLDSVAAQIQLGK